jgi:hypothetical protein
MSFPMKPTANPHATRRAVDAFNAAHAVGTPVLVAFEGGAERPGKILTRAFLSPAGPRVGVAFEGIDGRFDLNRVRRAPGRTA